MDSPSDIPGAGPLERMSRSHSDLPFIHRFTAETAENREALGAMRPAFSTLRA